MDGIGQVIPDSIKVSRAVRAASDPPGVFQDVQLVRASTSPFTSGSRWGDYSGTTSDPVEPGSFWGIQNVELFNFLTQQFELVSSTAAEQNDTMLTINATGDVSRFVTPGSGSLLARISFESNGPTLFFPWRATIDQFVWQISN